MRTRNSVGDFEKAARNRLPRKIYGFIRAGSGAGLTLDRNTSAYRRWALRSRVLTDVSTTDISATVLGQRYDLPLFLAPTGLQGIVWPDGELAMARAARSRGVGLAVSANAACPLEQVAQAHGSGPRWMQVSLWRDPSLLESFVERAEESGYTGLVVLLADRLASPRHGRLVRPTPADILDGTRRLRWAARFARKRVVLGNFRPYSADRSLRGTLEYSQQQINPGARWSDLERLRRRWKGHLLVKGAEHAEDARRLVGLGVDGFVASNSGGRGLDPAVPSTDVLVELRTAVGHEIPILVDGSIRSGTDIVIARCLGADAVLIGRAALWGLAVGGQRGVEEVIDLLATQVHETLVGMGIPAVSQLGRDLLHDTGQPRQR